MPSLPAPRVRFAPSPTGYLHIGGVRTALFNWLWARKTRGTFVLRIEDTDQERSTEESRRVILDAMRWLELDWDEGPEVGGQYGPYLQMERLPIYREFADRLIARGRAYRCYCTKEELDAQRAALKTKDPKAMFRYPGACRDRKEQPDRPFVVRFRAAETGSVTYNDLVFGAVTTPNSAQQDFVLVRTDGVPLYNFGAVVDDVSMAITLVARARDHMVNTPPQIMLYEAFGYATPTFAHLPLMLAQNGDKLSKRHGAVSVEEYKNLGYPPAGVLNYLVRFGWSHGDEEIFSREDLVQKFDFAAVGRSDGKFDPKKFADVVFEHLKRPDLTPVRRYAKGVTPFLDAIGITDPDEAKLLRAIPTVRERARTLRDAADAMDYFFRPPAFDEKAKKKFLTPESASKLADLKSILAPLASWDESTLEGAITGWLAAKNLAIKDVAQPARVSLTGRTISPGLYEVLAVLGKDESLARLDRGIELCERVTGFAFCRFLESLPEPVGPALPSAGFSLAKVLGTSYLRALLPIPVIVAIAPVIWLVFRKTWRDLDIESQIHRSIMLERDEYDFRPAVMLVMAAIILTLQDYYGGRSTYDDLIRPWLMNYELLHEGSRVNLVKYDELYSYAWWGFARFAGYVLIPFPVYKLIFRHDRLLDMGLRTRGFISHAWIYFLCLSIVLPALWLVSRQPDFGNYYPFYKGASRSYFDLLLWELIYFGQFFGLELFFRGLWLGALRRSLGSGAIFSMCVPYCMIHFGKPYLEANGAIIAGIVLGSLSMRTKSIYAGFLVHVTVALTMDWVALSHRHALPHVFWPPG